MLLLKRVHGLVVRLSFSSTSRKSKNTPFSLCEDFKVLCRYLTLKPAFKIPVLEFLGQVRRFQGNAVFRQLLQGLFPEMINQMRDETVQFQEEQLVLQEGATLESGADVLLVGIEQQKAECRPDHHHDQNQETRPGVS